MAADNPIVRHPAVQRELEMARARNSHPLIPTGKGRGPYGKTVQAVEAVHAIYLPDALFRWYWVERQSTYEIADYLGVTQGTVSHWLLGLNQRAILERAARQLQEDPGWALEGKDAWQPPRQR